MELSFRNYADMKAFFAGLASGFTINVRDWPLFAHPDNEITTAYIYGIGYVYLYAENAIMADTIYAAHLEDL